jgi:hypothetical protein
MIKEAYGVIRGRTIEISEDLGLVDGDQVKLTVEPMSCRSPIKSWGEGLRRCAGALADSWTEEDDRILEEIYRERQRDTRPEVDA